MITFVLSEFNFGIGEKGVGKTGLINQLTRKWTAVSAATHVRRSTLDTQEFEFTSIASGGEKKTKLQIWKFRGDNPYDNTHQFYFSGRAIYLILLNATQPHSEAIAEYWVQKIVARIVKPRIIICATHIDSGHQTEVTNQRISNITEKFSNLFRDVVQSIDVIGVSCKTGENIRKLRGLVEMLVGMHKSFGELVSGNTLLLETTLREHVAQLMEADKSQPPMMTRKNMNQFARNCGVASKDLSKSLDYLREDRQIFYWPHPSSFVILDATWLASVLSTLISGGYK